MVYKVRDCIERPRPEAIDIIGVGEIQLGIRMNMGYEFFIAAITL